MRKTIFKTISVLLFLAVASCGNKDDCNTCPEWSIQNSDKTNEHEQKA